MSQYEGMNVYKLSSDKQFNIAKFLPGTILSLTGTTVKREMISSTTRRRKHGEEITNYVLRDRKHRRQYRAQAESNGSSKAKYVLFVQKDGNLYYTPVDLFKATANTQTANTMSLEDLETQELERRNQFERKLNGRSALSAAFDKADADAPEAFSVKAKGRGGGRAMGTAKRSMGLGDEERDADFNDIFDDDEDAPVTMHVEPEQAEELTEDDEALANKEKSKRAIEQSSTMDELVGSDESDLDDEDMPDLDGSSSEASVEDADSNSVESKTRRKRVSDDQIRLPAKKARIDVSEPVATMPVEPSLAAPPARQAVSEADVRAQFETHGRLTAKSLANKLEDKWKYGGPDARRKMMEIVKRICVLKAGESNVKYLVLKH